MRTLTVRRSPAPIALASTLLVAFVLLFAWPQAAAAHDSLVDSDPVADSTVDTLPPELTLTFSAALIGGEGSTEVVVLDADENNVAEGEPELDGALVVQPLASEAAAGEYQVIWKVVSSDGHPTSGEFGFTVTSGTSDGTSPEASPPATPTPEATAAPSPESTDSATQTPAEGTPADGDAFLRVLPWILAALVIAGGGGALVAVLMARSRKSATASDPDGDASDSDDPAER